MSWISDSFWRSQTIQIRLISFYMQIIQRVETKPTWNGKTGLNRPWFHRREGNGGTRFTGEKKKRVGALNVGSRRQNFDQLQRIMLPHFLMVGKSIYPSTLKSAFPELSNVFHNEQNRWSSKLLLDTSVWPEIVKHFSRLDRKVFGICFYVAAFLNFDRYPVNFIVHTDIETTLFSMQFIDLGLKIFVKLCF